MTVLPCSEACERNKEPIAQILRNAFSGAQSVLEIGSGTGQHAQYLALQLPQVQWWPSDRPEWLEVLAARVDAAQAANLRPPLNLDVSQAVWPIEQVDAVFSANSLHIMSWWHVEQFFAGVGRVLAPRGAALAIYGPFRYGGQYTSQSNAEFDLWLKNRDAASGIRDFEAVDALAQAQGLRLAADHAMPANNQLLHWVR